MILAYGSRLAKIIPRLVSNHSGEIVATVVTIRRLERGGLDLHDLAREIEQPATVPVEIPHHARRHRRERTPRTSSLDPEVLRLLRSGLALDCFTAWEIGFADTTLTAAGRPGWPALRHASYIMNTAPPC